MRLMVPKLPHYEILNNLPKDQAEELFNQWEQECHEVQEKNKIQFEKDLKKIKCCAFLRGFRKSLTFSIDPRDNVRVNSLPHYSWCPYDEWTDTSGKYSQIEIAEKI